MPLNQVYMKNKIIYDEFKNILSGCNNIIDAYYYKEKYMNKYKDYPEHNDYLNGMINGKNYKSTLDNNNIIGLLKAVDKIKYKEDCLKELDRLNENKLDNITIFACTRVSKTKPNRPHDNKHKYNNNNDNNNNNISNNISNAQINNDCGDVTDNINELFDKILCPHCGDITTIFKDFGYIICGYANHLMNYNNEGFDKKGCGKDWCTICSKILCKTWGDDMLYVINNRKHNSTCCYEHSLKNNLNYNLDYCHCNNEFVTRIN